MVVWRNFIAQFQNFLLQAVQLFSRDTCRRQFRAAVVIGNTEEDIAAAKVVEVIGKSAQGVQNSLRIPAAYKLKPFPFHRETLQHFMDIDR